MRIYLLNLNMGILIKNAAILQAQSIESFSNIPDWLQKRMNKSSYCLNSTTNESRNHLMQVYDASAFNHKNTVYDTAAKLNLNQFSNVAAEKSKVQIKKLHLPRPHLSSFPSSTPIIITCNTFPFHPHL